MNCYECAKNGTDSAAVAACPDCSAGLCLRHVRDAARVLGRGGTYIGCTHDTWTATTAAFDVVPAAAPVMAAPEAT